MINAAFGVLAVDINAPWIHQNARKRRVKIGESRNCPNIGNSSEIPTFRDLKLEIIK